MATSAFPKFAAYSPRLGFGIVVEYSEAPVLQNHFPKPKDWMIFLDLVWQLPNLLRLPATSGLNALDSMAKASDSIHRGQY
jgi:hypothetical protein